MTTTEASLSGSPSRDVGKSPPYKSVLDLGNQQPLEEDAKSDLSLLLEVVKKERRLTRVRALRLDSDKLSYSIDKQTRTELDGQVRDSPRLRERMREDSQIRDYLPRARAGESQAEKQPTGKGDKKETRKQRRRDKRRQNREKKRNEKNDDVTGSNEQTRVASDNALREQTGEDKPPVLERVITSIARIALPKVMLSQVRLAQQPIEYETVSVTAEGMQDQFLTPVLTAAKSPPSSPTISDAFPLSNTSQSPDSLGTSAYMSAKSTASEVAPVSIEQSLAPSKVFRLPADDNRPLVLPSETPCTALPSPNLGEAPQTVAAPCENVSHPAEDKPVEQKVAVTAEGMQDQFLTPVLTVVKSPPSSLTSVVLRLPTDLRPLVFPSETPCTASPSPTISDALPISNTSQSPDSLGTSAKSRAYLSAKSTASEVAPVSIEQPLAPSKVLSLPADLCPLVFPSETPGLSSPNLGKTPQTVAAPFENVGHPKKDKPAKEEMTGSEPKNTQQLLPPTAPDMVLAQFSAPNLGKAPQTVADPFENVSHPKEDKPVEQKVAVTSEGMQDKYPTPVLTAVKSPPSSLTSVVLRLPADIRPLVFPSETPGTASPSPNLGEAPQTVAAPFENVGHPKEDKSVVQKVTVPVAASIGPSPSSLFDRPFETALSSNESFAPQNKSSKDLQRVRSVRDLAQFSQEEINFLVNEIYKPVTELTGAEPKNAQQLPPPTAPDMVLVQSSAPNLGKAPQTVAAPFENVSRPKDEKPVEQKVSSTALNRAAATLSVSSSTLQLPEPTGDAEVDELMRQINAHRGDRKVKLAGPCTENPHTYFYRQQEHFLQEVISTPSTKGIREQLAGSESQAVAPPIENEFQLIEAQQRLMEREKSYLKHVHGQAGEKHDSSASCRECGKPQAAILPAASGPQTETDDGLLNGQWLLLLIAYAVFITFLLLAKLI